MPKSIAHIVETKAGKFRVKYYAANGEMLAVSETIDTVVNARKNVRAMKKLMDGITLFGKVITYNKKKV